MYALGIIDDRIEQRESFENAVLIELNSMNLEIPIFSIHPFKDKNDYIPWILDNQISVIVLDEMLDDGEFNGVIADYNGHDLAVFLKEKIKDLPLFVVTSNKDFGDLQEKFRYFNLISDRDDFFKDSKSLVNLFVNSGQKFSRDFHEELSNLSILSRKIALGEATEEDIKSAITIQESLQIPVSELYSNDRTVWLNEFESNLNELNELNNEIKEFLKKNKR